MVFRKGSQDWFPCNMRIDWQTLATNYKGRSGMPLHSPESYDCFWSISLLPVQHCIGVIRIVLAANTDLLCLEV
jgi:hypothetical protein